MKKMIYLIEDVAFSVWVGGGALLLFFCIKYLLTTELLRHGVTLSHVVRILFWRIGFD